MTKKYDAELGRECLELRRAGVSFDVIADRLGLTIRAAKALFDKALATYDPDLSVQLEAARLDGLHAAIWPQAVAGDVNAIDRVLRIGERRDRVVTTPRNNDHALRIAFDASATSSDHVEDGWDEALLEAGRKIADRVDAAVASGEGQEVTKALYLVPHMLNVLREMLATPASRVAAEATAATQPAGPRRDTKLAQLRALQGRTG